MDVENWDNLRNDSSEVPDDGIVPDISYTNRVILSLLFLLISSVGTGGNTLVITAVMLSRKLQTRPNVFVVNLAIADLVTSFFIICQTLAILGPNGWPFPNSKWLCAVTAFMITFCVGVSLVTLAAISINRYVLITKPYQTYQKIYSSCNVGLMVVATWMIPFANMIIMTVSKFQYTKVCSTPDISLFRLVFIFIVLVTVLISYALVFRHVRHHIKKKRQWHRREALALALTSRHHTTCSVTSAEQADSRRENGFSNKSLQVTKNLAMVVVAFFLCFMPYFAIKILSTDVVLIWYSAVLAFANSAINPIIYGRRHPHFKEVFLGIIKCRLHNIPEPTGIAKRWFTRIHPMT